MNQTLERLFGGRTVVTCVSAAGSGKTVQALLYAHSAGVPLAWLTLDRADASPARLLVSLATSLEAYATEGVEAVQATLRSGLSSQEAAAVLAETIRPNRVLFVMDECESIMGSDEALSVIGTFLEYLPGSVRVLLLSREHFLGPIRQGSLDGTFGSLFEDELSLTMEETENLIDVLGLSGVDASEAHAATGGWMAGVVFGYRYDVRGGHDYYSPEFGSYIGQEVLGRLPPEEQRFLLDTSVLDVVTPDIVQAMLGVEGRSLFERVRTLNLPATTSTRDQIVYHSVLRSFLRSELIQEDPDREADLRARFAKHLMAHAHYEEATEIYLALGDLDSASAATEKATKSMFRRAEWSTLLRWLDALGESRIAKHPALLAAQIRALHGDRRFNEAIVLVERCDRLGQLRRATTADPALLATIGWLMQAKPADALRYLDKYEGDYRVAAVRYMIEATTGSNAVVPPPGTDWDDVQRPMAWGLLWQGRFNELLRLAPDAEDSPVINPNVLLALAWRGDVATARGMWKRVPMEIRERPHSKFVEASILLSEGHTEHALDVAEQAISGSVRSGFGLGQTYELFAAQIMVILGRVEDALALVTSRLGHIASTGELALLEWAQTILGAAFLKSNRAADAELVLEECVQSMSRARRRLYLPIAAVYLSEAKARLGKEDEAFEAAELAYHTATLIGSQHRFLAAIRSVPTVLERQQRRLPADPRWSRLTLGDPLRKAHASNARDETINVYVQSFSAGRELLVNDVPAYVGRWKVVELAALLALHPGGIDRFELQLRLFPEADQRRGGNHFRQIAHKLREATGISLVRTSGNLMSWPEHVTIDSADLKFERLVEEARGSSGAARLDGFLAALELTQAVYLPNSDLNWADERRYQLDVLMEESLLESATLLLEHGQPERSREHCGRLLELNPYSEPAYRTLVLVERTIGTESSAMAVYRRAVSALDELGLKPGPRLRELLRKRVGALTN